MNCRVPGNSFACTGNSLVWFRIIGRECKQDIGILRAWWDASCLLLWPQWVWMQANHWNSWGLMRCVLLIIVVLLCMNAAKQLEYLGFGEMHPVYHCIIIGCECNHTIGFPWVWWDAPCLWTEPSFGVNATNPWEFLGLTERHPVYSCGLIGCECNQTIGIPRVWCDASCLLLCPRWVWMQPNHWNSSGLVRCILLIVVVLLCMNAAKP